MKLKLKQLTSYLLATALSVAGLGVLSCESSTTAADYQGVQSSEAFDPSKPVKISRFTPDRGSVGQQIVITGENFGNDTSRVKVTIGGKDAVVVSVRSSVLYAYVPGAAYDKVSGQVLTGEVEVSVSDGAGTTKTGTAPGVFTYERKMVVGRLCGRMFDAYDHAEWNMGSFAGSPDAVSGFKNDGVMQFSPYNHDQLFIVYDQEPRFGTIAHSIQLLDLKEQTVKDILPLSLFSGQRLRTIDFAVDPFMYDEDGQFQSRLDDEGANTAYANQAWLDTASHDQLKWREHLIISADNNSDDYTANSVYIVHRDKKTGEFNDKSIVAALANYRQCNGASLHPNGELYFTSYTLGEVLRLDMDKYWPYLLPDSLGGPRGSWNPYAKNNWNDDNAGTNSSRAFEKLFTVQDSSWEFQVDIHPSGKYAYIVVINRSYILRTDYNEDTHRFSAPYRIAGDMSERGFKDGVGTSARLKRPYQGTFVKNEQYEAEGKEDIYDFYFCDSENDAIRLLTPEGIVKTYAGGGADTHNDGNTYGNENGELRDFARFHRPTGIVNDVHRDAITGENTLIFYILDTYNYCIRTITMEENLEAGGGDGSNGTSGTNE